MPVWHHDDSFVWFATSSMMEEVPTTGTTPSMRAAVGLAHA
jgi:hypothetical protein